VPPIRAIVVEDDPFARSTVSAALQGHGIDVVASCGTAADAVAMAADTNPDVAVTDLDLGRGPNGVAVAHALRRANPAIGIVLLTSHVDPRSVGTPLAQVPEGTEYVVKQSVEDIATLVLAMERSIMAAPGHSTPRPATTQPMGAALTDAQIDTLRLVAEGLTNAEIARRREVSVAAVERMVGRLITVLAIEEQPGYNRRMLLARSFETLSRGGTVNGLGTPE